MLGLYWVCVGSVSGPVQIATQYSDECLLELLVHKRIAEWVQRTVNESNELIESLGLI